MKSMHYYALIYIFCCKLFQIRQRYNKIGVNYELSGVLPMVRVPLRV